MRYRDRTDIFDSARARALERIVVSRRRNAVIFAVFSYGQSVVAMLLGLVVTRAVLAHLGRDLYGLWVASGALLSYAGLADLGVLSVLPWMIAEADGKKDIDRIRALLSNASAFAVGGGVVFALIGAGLWHLFPALLHLSSADRALLSGPVFVVVGATAIAFPLRVFSALLTGVQDASFIGPLAVAQILTTGVVTLALTVMGYGLYGLAIGTSVPPLLAALASFVRGLALQRVLLTNWPYPSARLLRPIMVDGLGAWLGTVGFQLAAGTDPVVLTYLGLRDSVPSFSVSSRLALTLAQFGWILPDAALVGLAQLAAEAPRERVREVVFAILRLHTIISGAVASAVLAANAGFVRTWVGSDLFLGTRFNAILAVNVVLLTAVRGLCTVASVLGKRLDMGLALVANGAVHIGLALILGRYVGVYGVVLATLISGATTCLPLGLRAVEATTGVALREIIGSVFLPWFVRFLPLAFVALILGRLGTTMPLALLIAACTLFGVAYLWWMKPLYRGLPLGPRVEGWLRKVRLSS